MKFKKKYTHNCKDCVFLGEFQENDLQYDLYWCSQSGMPTVIARYGDAGGDYLSGMPSQHPALDEAKARAEALELDLGFLKMEN